ncbi:MAG TPA: hypothetical protein VK395_22940 [Gemmataceae bacterium]|nr:hypothetical protein [Gemmataceae bacterium]
MPGRLAHRCRPVEVVEGLQLTKGGQLDAPLQEPIRANGQFILQHQLEERLATPLWAGVMAIVNQARAISGEPSLYQSP